MLENPPAPISASVEQLFREIRDIYEQYKREVPRKRGPWPQAIQSRVLELWKLGISTHQISQGTGLACQTMYSWRQRLRKQLADGFLPLPVVKKRRCAAVYDPLFHATNPAMEVTYVYDALGRRIRKHIIDHRAPSDVTKTFERRYVYDGQEILLEYDGDNSLLARYTHSTLRTDDVLAVDVKQAGVTAGLAQNAQSYVYLKDALGSVRDVADTGGNKVARYPYSAFGTIVGIQDAQANDVTNNPPIRTAYGFTNREHDSESGMMYYRARYYDPSSGRFLQKDPDPGKAGVPASVVNSQAYVLNNPTAFRDPTGMSLWTDIRKGIKGAIAGAIAGGPIGMVAGAVGSQSTSEATIDKVLIVEAIVMASAFTGFTAGAAVGGGTIGSIVGAGAGGLTGGLIGGVGSRTLGFDSFGEGFQFGFAIGATVGGIAGGLAPSLSGNGDLARTTMCHTAERRYDVYAGAARWGVQVPLYLPVLMQLGFLSNCALYAWNNEVNVDDWKYFDYNDSGHTKQSARLLCAKRLFRSLTAHSDDNT